MVDVKDESQLKVGIVDDSGGCGELFGIVVRASKEMLIAATKHEEVMNCIVEDVRRIVAQKSKELIANA